MVWGTNLAIFPLQFWTFEIKQFLNPIVPWGKSDLSYIIVFDENSAAKNMINVIYRL